MKNYVRKNLFCLFMVVILFFSISCSKSSRSESSSESAKNKDYSAVDYLSDNSSNIININNVQYNYIDKYSKWAKALYLKKDFDALTKHIQNLLENNNEETAYELYSLYRLLGTITADKHIDLMNEVLNGWCTKEPKSHIPWLVRGSFYIRWAWYLRGSGWAKDVPESVWPKFEEKLKLAKNDLNRSIELNPHDPNSYCELLIVAKALGEDDAEKNFQIVAKAIGKDNAEKIFQIVARVLGEDNAGKIFQIVAKAVVKEKAEAENIFQNGINVAPWHYGLYAQKFELLSPRWGGSYEELMKFADSCYEMSKQYPLLGIIKAKAYLEIHYYNNPNNENYLGRDDVWQNIEDIFNAVINKYPNEISMHFIYAYYAYKANKLDIAQKQFELIGNQWIDGTRWKSFESYNEARAFTYYKNGEDLLWKRGLCEMAIDNFQQANLYNPTGNSYYGLGVAYWRSAYNRRDINLLNKAEESFQLALKIEPDHKRAREELKKLREYTKNILTHVSKS